MFSFRIKIRITFSTKYWQRKSKKIKIIKITIYHIIKKKNILLNIQSYSIESNFIFSDVYTRIR